MKFKFSLEWLLKEDEDALAQTENEISITIIELDRCEKEIFELDEKRKKISPSSKTVEDANLYRQNMMFLNNMYAAKVNLKNTMGALNKKLAKLNDEYAEIKLDEKMLLNKRDKEKSEYDYEQMRNETKFLDEVSLHSRKDMNEPNK